MNITNLQEKIKGFREGERGRNTALVAVVVLTGLVSFGFGRLSALAGKEAVPPVVISQDVPRPLSPKPAAKEELPAGGPAFFASSRGTKFYPVSCKAGQSIKAENRIYFNTRQEAIAKGYELSGSCS